MRLVSQAFFEVLVGGGDLVPEFQQDLAVVNFLAACKLPSLTGRPPKWVRNGFVMGSKWVRNGFVMGS